MGVSRTMRAASGPCPRALSALAVVALVCSACARRPAEAVRLVPPLRVHTSNGFLWAAVAQSPSFLYVQQPEQAELLAGCREEADFRRSWAFPAVLVNLLTLPVGYFTFAFRCTTTLTADVTAEARGGSAKFSFREQASASGVFLQYQKRPEPGDTDLHPGFEATRDLARRALEQRVADRLADEWAQRHPERALRLSTTGMRRGR